MSKRILLSDPDHPVDPKDPRYIKMLVDLDRKTGNARFISFYLPADADPRQKFFVQFSKTTVDASQEGCSPTASENPVRCYRIELDPLGPWSLPFDSCDKEACVARLEGGRLAEEGDLPTSPDLLGKLLTRNRIHFLYTRKGEPFRTIDPLSGFQAAYRGALRGPAKPPSP